MLRMSSYAGQSLNPATFICTPCRLLLARRAAVAATTTPLATFTPRLLNHHRLRTYSVKGAHSTTDAAPSKPLPPTAPKKKKKKRKVIAKPAAPKLDDSKRSDTDVAMIQEALNKIKSVIYGGLKTSEAAASPTKTKEQRQQPEKPKPKSKTARRRINQRKLKGAPQKKSKSPEPEGISEPDKQEEKAKLATLAEKLGGKLGNVQKLAPGQQKQLKVELNNQNGEAAALGAFLAAQHGQTGKDTPQSTGPDKDRPKVTPKPAKSESAEAGVASKATKQRVPEKKKAPEKTKVSPLLAHLNQPEEDGKPSARKQKQHKIVPDIVAVHAKELGLTPIEREHPPVPGLSYGLDRVLFNPGVYHLQDPRSRVYNFDPYLAGIMPVKEFDFDALKQYVTSSKDTTLIGVAAEHKKKYAGSTSSMTSMLAHFHYLLSSWRPINTDNLTRAFPVESTNFTLIQRCPAAIFLHWKDGTYAIDADKEFDSANVLSMLGKSMEKLLTLPKEDFEKYRRVNSSQLTEEERNADEAYHYTTMGDFMMRSQLDAHDPRVPGTGMFDLKTRAVVSIRMDAKDYQKGVGYEIRRRFGQWESYEREYYDMIRSAFLKYSLQVRMGRMDGIFVAFHNTQRIFGFQYIPLSEMDQALHGTGDTTLGNQEFKFSLHLLNKLLDKATQKWPERSLRLHFETRPSATPFMYVFATPVTKEQIDEVQNKNKAEVERFERELMGIMREEDRVDKNASSLAKEDVRDDEEDQAEEQEDGEEETSLDVWEDMRAKVEESLENDELGADFVRDVMEDALEASGLLQTGSHDEKESYLDAIMEVITIGSEVNRGDKGENTTDGQITIGENGHVEERSGEDKPVAESATRESESLGEGERQEKSKDVYESDGKDQGVLSEASGDSDEPSLKDLIIRLATKSRDNPLQSGLPHADLSSDEQRLRKFEHILYQMVERTHELKSAATDKTSIDDKETSSAPTAAETTRSPESQEDEETIVGPEDAAETTLDKVNPDREVLGMILTLRNKVNGQYVTRPDDLKKSSNWTVEYAIEELPEERAKTLYESCLARRHKELAGIKQRKEYDNRFRENLEKLSDAGRKFRQKEVEKAKTRPVYVYGIDKPLKWEEVFSDTGEPMAENQVGK